MKRLLCGSVAACLPMLMILVTTARAQEPAAKPNVLLILLDDTVFGDLTTLIAKGKLSSIKALASEGVLWTNSFASGSVGSTSRVSIHSGQYAQNHLEFGQDLFFGGAPLHDESTLLPNWLLDAGYATGMIGRTIPGYGAGDLTETELQQIVAGTPVPLSWITEKYSTFPKASYVPPGWDFWVAGVEPYTWSTSKYKMSINGAKYDFSTLGVHQTDFFTLGADYFIRTAATGGKPWFLEVAPVTYNRELWPGPDRYNVCPSTTTPQTWWYGGPYAGVSERPTARHMNTIWNARSSTGEAVASANFPFPMPPSFNEADVADKPGWVQSIPPISSADLICMKRRYWRRLEGLLAIDEMVGYLRLALEQTNQLNNTYIILTADNGLADGEHRYSEKLSAYEEAIRVPLIIRKPGGPAPQIIGKMALGIDIAVTIAEITGATPTVTVDGRSLLPVMADPNVAWRRAALLQHTLGPWGPSFPGGAPEDYYGLRIDHGSQRLFVRYPLAATAATGELYDMATDPYQMDNLYASLATQSEVDYNNNWLQALRTCSGETCRTLEDTYNP
jgi:N-acetylglucosamine-6-sulfatase